MNRPVFNRTCFIVTAATLSSLLLTVARASALTQSTPDSVASGPAVTTLSPAGTAPARPHLMPAASVSSQKPTSSEEDIRDIRQPRHLPTRWPWVAMAAGIIVLGGALWLRRWLRHGKFFKMQPHEVALQHLAAARRLMDPDQAREYCFEVSRVVRRYIEEQFHSHAPQLTTEEFLRELVEIRETMLAAHRALLANFLEHCDLAKFAGWRYCRPDLEAMHNSAEMFVCQTTPTNKERGKTNRRNAPQQTNDDAISPGLARTKAACELNSFTK